MKKIYVLFFVITFLFACSADNGNNTDVIADRIIGTWNITSQKVNGAETADECRKQTTFTFEDSRVLRQKFFKTENNICTESSEDISSWFNLGNSSYRITTSGGSSSSIDIVFSENDTKFTTTEAEINDNEIVTVFEKF